MHGLVESPEITPQCLFASYSRSLIGTVLRSVDDDELLHRPYVLRGVTEPVNELLEQADDTDELEFDEVAVLREGLSVLLNSPVPLPMCFELADFEEILLPELWKCCPDAIEYKFVPVLSCFWFDCNRKKMVACRIRKRQRERNTPIDEFLTCCPVERFDRGW